MSRTWTIVLSIVMIVVGLAAIAVPFVAGVAMTAFVGWLLVFGGLVHIAFAWRSGTTGHIVGQVLLGLLYGAIGFYLIARPLAGLASLTFALAIYFLVEAALELVLSFQLRPAAGSGWLLFDAVVTFVLAILIWSTWPGSAVWVVGTLVGISILFSGISRLMLATAVRRVAL